MGLYYFVFLKSTSRQTTSLKVVCPGQAGIRRVRGCFKIGDSGQHGTGGFQRVCCRMEQCFVVTEETMRVDLYARSSGIFKLLRGRFNEVAYFESTFITTGKK